MDPDRRDGDGTACGETPQLRLAELEEIKEGVRGALEVEGADSGRGGTLEIGFSTVPAVGGVGGGTVEAVEGEVEDGGIGFAGAGVGGGDDVLEPGTDPEAVEDGSTLR